MDVGEWLRGLGLDQYEEKFRDDKIDADVLLRLTADDLKDIGSLGCWRSEAAARCNQCVSRGRIVPGNPRDPAKTRTAQESPRLGRAASNYGDVLRSRRLNGSGGAA